MIELRGLEADCEKHGVELERMVGALPPFFTEDTGLYADKWYCPVGYRDCSDYWAVSFIGILSE